MIFFTSDQHFGHENIIKYCDRPFKSSADMDKKLIQKHNEVVGPDDTIYIIGDMALAKARQRHYVEQILDKLNGTKHLILGNHDYLNPFTYEDIGIMSVHTVLALPEHNIVLRHDPATSAMDKTKIWLCGHVHGLFKKQKHVVNVGVDVWDYKPVSLEQIMEAYNGHNI